MHHARILGHFLRLTKLYLFIKTAIMNLKSLFKESVNHLMCMQSLALMAQNQTTISGKVVDDTGVTLPGVNIRVVGKSGWYNYQARRNLQFDCEPSSSPYSNILLCRISAHNLLRSPQRPILTLTSLW